MKLLYLNGAESGKVREIQPPGIGLGRETDNDIQILVGGVSRYHARMEFRDNVWTLRDLGSTNGTKLNGILLTQASRVKDGDVVSIGDQMFRCDDSSPAPPKTGSATLKIEPEGDAPAFVFRPPESVVLKTADPTQVEAPPDALKPVGPAPTTAAPPPSSSPYPATLKMQPTEQLPRTASLFGTAPDANPEEKPSQPSNLFGNLFGGRDNTPKPESASSKKKLLTSNVLFYVLVVMIAIFCVVLFWKINQPGNGNANSAGGNASGTTMVVNPFLLYYEKYTVTKQHSVFKLKVLIENKHLTFSLDDLQSGRVFSPVIPDEIPGPAIEKLKNAICDTSFLSASQQENFEDTAENNQNYSRLIVGFDDKFNDITVGETMLTSFSKVEEAVRTFLAEEYNLDPSMVESRETLIREARQTFDLAENQFNSYKMNPSNLWRAIENYRIAKKQYEVFADKPPEWKIANERYMSAQAIQDEIKKNGNKKVNLLYQKHEFFLAVAECEHLMAYFPPDSDTYKNIKDLKIKIEHIMNGEKK